MSDFVIGPAEFAVAATTVDGHIHIGEARIPWPQDMAHIYVRRLIQPGDPSDGKVMEVHLAAHDGLAQEDLSQMERDAEQHPLGPVAFFRIHDAYMSPGDFAEEMDLDLDEVHLLDAEIQEWREEAELLESLLRHPSASSGNFEK